MTQLTFRSDMPVNLIMHAGGDHMVAGAAWVSTSGAEALSKAQDDNARLDGLINALMRQRHGTPFEHGFMTFAITAPIFVWREFHRHRVGFSYNEESGRYKILEPVFWIPRRDRPMLRAANHRSMAPVYEPLPEGEPGDTQYQLMFNHTVDNCKRAYYDYLDEVTQRGIANEVARRLLPLNTYSSCWVSCNPRSLMHFLSLRVHDPDATFVSYPQREIQEVAEQMEALFERRWPITHAAFVKHGRVGP